MWSVLLMTALLATARTKQLPNAASDLQSTTVATVSDSNPHSTSRDSVAVSCERDAIHITVSLPPPQRHGRNSGSETFNGIIYPAGLGSNSSCLREYVSQRGDLQYTLPLKGCNTMANDNDDGTIEYYNTIIVQPQLRLVTGQGRGYHVACRYSHRDLTHFHVYAPRADRLTNSLADSPDYQVEFDDEPSVKMKIYKGDPKNKQVASNVRIGEPLTLVVSLQKQKQYGLLVSVCAVGDGLGWAEQTLIADDGCPLDGEIMGMFHYSPDRQQAHVSFPAHKFPYTASVYYTCEVKLCDLNHPTDCEACSPNRVRHDVAEQSEGAEDEYNNQPLRRRRDTEGAPARVEVFSGLYVNEPDSPDLIDDVHTEKKDGEICISQRNFAIGICIAGVILMICVIAAIAFILARRRSPKAHSRTGSSLYSGPYTNTGYSHTS